MVTRNEIGEIKRMMHECLQRNGTTISDAKPAWALGTAGCITVGSSLPSRPAAYPSSFD